MDKRQLLTELFTNNLDNIMIKFESFKPQIMGKKASNIQTLIDKYEKIIKSKLPTNYKNILLKYNGEIIFDREVYIYPIKKIDVMGKRNYIFLGSLFGGNKLLSAYDTYHNYNPIPKNSIPIGETYGENIIWCMFIRGQKAGNIYIWDHETEEIGLVAKTFDKFILKCKTK